jgi:hypothetical protein
VAASVLGASVLTGCHALDEGHGPIRKICGETIAAADGPVGPWYRDVSTRSASISLTEDQHDGLWLRLSRDCARGTTVRISNPSPARLRWPVRAGNGAYVAVNLVARSPGTTILAYHGGQGRLHHVTVHVTREPVGCTSPLGSAGPSIAEPCPSNPAGR